MEAAPKPPRVLSQGRARLPKVRAAPAEGRRTEISAVEERSFLGSVFTETALDEVAEERSLKGGTVSIGTRDGEWYYCLRPIEIDLPENARFAIETMMGRLAERADLDISGLLGDQKLARELVRTVALQAAPGRWGLTGRKLPR